MVLEERYYRDNAGGRYVDRQFILPYRELLDVFGHARKDVLAVGMKGLFLVLVLVGRVNDGSDKSSTSCFKDLATLDPF